ncbi:MAG: NAD(P)-dependent oxidoreductase [Selenomonadaceae bacterium]|nr:NAD(P)-dependent oxidoreductase [Selenomonadaceae bacterium]
MAVHVLNEARRCLQCKKPLCRLKGCPVETNIPEMIRLFLAGESETAGKMLFDNNPLSIVCSLVCDHENQCEGNCIQGRRGAAINIPSIENYISDAYLDKVIINREESKGQKVAIIGAGPAGITIAIKLAERGYDITIFERMDKVGGMMRYGIPAFRLPRMILDRYQVKLRQMGIHFRPNTSIGGAIHLDDLFTDGYDAVFIGTGVWRPNRTHCKGESLGNVHFAIDYLQNPEAYDLGDTVAIIGAGNSAIDVARTVVRMGSRHVTIYARRQRIAASQRELDYAQVDGIDVQQGMQIKEFTDKGPVFIPRIFDEEGNLLREEEPVLVLADSTIIAISQGPKDKIVNTTTNLEINNKGLIVVDDGGKTSHEGVFASGDVVAGSKNVVLAVKYSKLVAKAMDEYLTAKREASTSTD